MISIKRTIIAGAVAAIGFMGLSTAATAATACTDFADGTNSTLQGIEDKAVNAASDYSGCEYFTVSGQPDLDDFNGLELFGLDNWADIGAPKVETTSGAVTTASWGSASQTEVSVEITELLFGGKDLIFVALKDGQDADPGNVVAYSFDQTFIDQTITILSPFSNPGDPLVTKGISNVQIFGASCPVGSFGCPSDTTPIPLPAGLPLLLSALGLGAFVRMRIRKSA